MCPRAEPTLRGSCCAGAGEPGNPVQDGGLWDWFSPVGWADRGDHTSEVTYPKRLVQQIESEEELAHDRLDTRVKNSSGDTSVSFNSELTLHCQYHCSLLDSVYESSCL